MFGRWSSHEREQPSVGCLACDTSSWSFDASKRLFAGGGSSGLAGRIGCSTLVYWERGSVAPVTRKCRHRLSLPPPRPHACIPRCVSRAMSLGRIRFRDRKPCAPRLDGWARCGRWTRRGKLLLHCIVPVSRVVASFIVAPWRHVEHRCVSICARALTAMDDIAACSRLCLTKRKRLFQSQDAVMAIMVVILQMSRAVEFHVALRI